MVSASILIICWQNEQRDNGSIHFLHIASPIAVIAVTWFRQRSAPSKFGLSPDCISRTHISASIKQIPRDFIKEYYFHTKVNAPEDSAIDRNSYLPEENLSLC
ncbi:hypothetical protein BDV28DRAFT_137111 [Aspergillus coremiiformis]|uniref:Uncharacterized protein n=1 Tax=Aspergillus coremiiformis TaxID=138285 RepID=A0A5N6Z190_9EURO|nr:hypothetical protein BDV28DRAFT_137111 [Aspergillus coremiiformis]